MSLWERCVFTTEISAGSQKKDLGHIWLSYMRMLRHLQHSATYQFLKGSKIAFTCMDLSLTCYKCYLNIGTITIESVPHPWGLLEHVRILKCGMETTFLYWENHSLK